MNIDDVAYSVVMCTALFFCFYVFGKNNGYREVASRIRSINVMFEHDPNHYKPYIGPHIVWFESLVSASSYLIIIPIVMLLKIVWGHPQGGIILTLLLIYPSMGAFGWGVLRSKESSKRIFAKHYPEYYKVFKDKNPGYAGKDRDIYLDYIRLQAEVCGTKDELPCIPSYYDDALSAYEDFEY